MGAALSPSAGRADTTISVGGCAATGAAVPNALTKIVARKRQEVALAKRTLPMEALQERISELGRPRNFFQAVVAHGNRRSTRIIAEVKRSSPSAGLIRADFDPVAIARQYHRAGAAAISCLTDEADFGGSLEFIHAIRDAIPLPVLRKDFIIDAYQVWEARAFGADAILLIAECLTEAQIVDFQILAVELGMTTLVEVHDLDNLWRVQPHIGFPHRGYSLLGLNNRNLKTMKTDLSHSLRIADMIEDRSIVVAESGIRTSADLLQLRAHDIHIALVGEHLLRQPDPEAALKALLA